jgi:anti-sigma B factor antagonist
VPTRAEIRTDPRGDVTVLHLGGRLTLGDADVALAGEIKSLLAKGPVKLVVDLSDTNYIDSAGLGALVSAYTSVTSAGGTLALAAPSKRVIDLLEITRLYSVLPVFPSVDEAVASVSTRSSGDVDRPDAPREDG